MSTTSSISSGSADRLAQARGWMSPLNLHVIGVGALLLVNLYLVLHVLFVWSGRSKNNDEAMAQARARVVAADLSARPLRGLDEKIAKSDVEAAKFYKDRLPYAYSDFLTELGVLQKRENVVLSRTQYVPVPPVHSLTEVRMETTLTGEYQPLVRFINGLERDHLFFLVRGIGLTGQQSGVVNLRLRIVTYLREPMPTPGANAVLPPAVEGAAQR